MNTYKGMGETKRSMVKNIDFAGPVQSQTFFIIVDAYSKWLEIILMTTTTAEATITALWTIFTTHGLPDVLVSNNGAQFTAKKIEAFLAERDPTCPGCTFSLASNGQTEWIVQSTKETLVRMGPRNWQTKIDQFLLTQHITPSATNNRSPIELLMGHNLRSQLDRLHPNYNAEAPLDSSSQPQSFTTGDVVYAHNYAGELAWVRAKVIAITGPQSYHIELEDRKVWRRHIDQLQGQIGKTSLQQPEDTLSQIGSKTALEPDSTPPQTAPKTYST